MHTILTPDSLVAKYGRYTPETLARLLGFTVQRQEHAPVLPGINVLSEYQNGRRITLFNDAVQRAAHARQITRADLEQWQIAHELYHGLAEAEGISPWQLSESEADAWADRLLALIEKE